MTKRFLPLLCSAFFLILINSNIQAQSLPAKHIAPEQNLTNKSPMNLTISEAGNSEGFDMAPETTLKVVEAAVKQIPNKMVPFYSIFHQNQMVLFPRISKKHCLGLVDGWELMEKLSTIHTTGRNLVKLDRMV